MKKIFLLITINLFGFITLSAQSIINTPTINKYANVLDIDYCKNTIEVPTGLGVQFSIGDKLLIIQMKGASLNEGNNANSGKIDDYNNAGNYEINEIKSVNSGANDIITFKYQIERNFDVSGAVQIVNIPQYEDVVIENTLTCLAWDGSIGGILAFNATGKITLNASINVSEKGFRGGIAQDLGGAGCFSGFGYTGFNCELSIECGAPKGEGIGNRFESQELARTPNANGGGGGNDHNAGGGGGGAYGIGGLGGERTNGSCNGYGGFGGVKLDYVSENKMLFSGGGGAGDAGNLSTISGGTSGGNAGAIVFISGNSIQTNGNKIISNGQNVTDLAIGDGAGAGGAGGLIVLELNSFLDQTEIENIGGNGGNVQDDDSCPGPGAGGSGGSLWLSSSSVPSNINLISNGGLPGILTILPCIGSNNGATAGENGGFLFDFPSYEADDLFEQLTLTAGSDTIICGEGVAPLRAEASASNNFNFEWNWTNGSETEMNFNFDPEFPGQYNVSANARYVYNDQVCEEIFIVKVDIRKPKIDIVASSFFGDTVKTGDAVFVNAVISPLNSAYIYEWTPSDRVNPNNDRNAIATAAITEQVCLKVTDELGCSNTECVDIFVYEPFIKTPDAFSPNGDDRNDSFIPILSEDLKVVSFKVYDRWGDLVYATSENIAWDGTKNGKELPSDLYIWHIKTKQILSNVIFERQGNVSIVR